MNAPLEIERKWIVNGWPKGIVLIKEESMRQGYLHVHPTIRIREEWEEGSAHRFLLCCKSGGKLVRKEVEFPIAEEQFRALEDLIALPLIPKIRRSYCLETGQRLEVNRVEPEAASTFWYAEVEFSSEKEARAWKIPSFLSPYLSEEVTEKKGFSMGAYWIRTRLNK